MKLESLPDILTAKELATYLSLSTGRVYELMNTEIPCLQIGRSKRVLKADLVVWLNSKKGD